MNAGTTSATGTVVNGGAQDRERADGPGGPTGPIVYQGVIYVTTHAATMAIDVKTGKQIWKTKVEYPPETPRIVCCGIINRGVAIHEIALP